jgi:hypothetical protein
MKNLFVVSIVLLIGSTAFAQQGESEIRRDNFHAHDVVLASTPAQISYVTPPDLLKTNNSQVQVPTAAQISTVTPPALLKAPAGIKPVQPDSSQIIYETRTELLNPKQ